MPDTPRTLAALQALLADNTSAAISPQDIRDFLVSLFVQTTKGDLPGIDAAGIIGRLPATTDGFVLTLDATQTYGFKWAAAGSGAVATDTIWDAAGDLAVGTGADTAARLAISVPAADIVNVPGVVNGESTLSYKSLMDATAPTTQAFGDAAAAGTGVMLARVTHKHAMPANPVTAHEAAYAHGDIAGHIADAADAHDASAISILDAANDFTATDVEGALAELQADNEAHVAAADPHTGYYLADGSRKLTGGATLDGIAAPGTPAADDIVVYNETGTDLLKAKEDNGNVYSLTHKHLINILVDGTTTTQFAEVGPMPHAGTITDVTCRTCDDVAIGATAWVGNIYKRLAANLNATTKTSIFTVAPTITTGNYRQLYGAPDSVTTFAAGDYFAFATTQVGSSATFVQMGMTVRYT